VRSAEGGKKKREPRMDTKKAPIKAGEE